MVMSAYKPHPITILAFILSLAGLIVCAFLLLEDGPYKFERGQQVGAGAFALSMFIAAIVEYIIRGFKSE